MIISNSTPLINFAAIQLMDELQGRSIAKSYDLDCLGSIGCLVEAKRKGIIPAIRPLLDAMRTQARFWVHPKLYALILQENGEYT